MYFIEIGVEIWVLQNKNFEEGLIVFHDLKTISFWSFINKEVTLFGKKIYMLSINRLPYPTLSKLDGVMQWSLND